MTETAGLLIVFAISAILNYAYTRFDRSGETIVFWLAFGVLLTLCISACVKTNSIRLSIAWMGQRIVMTNQQHAAYYELKFLTAFGIPTVIGIIMRYLEDQTRGEDQ